MEAAGYRCGHYHVDLVNRRVVHRGQEIALEPRVFAVIARLLAKPGTLVQRHELLDAVWGHRFVTPSALNRTIVLARRVFADGSGEQSYIQTVHGAGYRFVGPLEVLAGAEREMPAHFGPPPIARVPARLGPLIGRESELAQLAQLMLRERAVTVLGTGGMGKTECALEAARRAADQHVDGVWFFDLTPAQSGEEWLLAWAAALSIPPGPADGVLEKLAALLAGRRALLVLDNCDRVTLRAGEHVVQLLRRTDALRVLATSQEPLRFAGEHVMRMPPLSLPQRPASGPISRAAVLESAAVAMLRERIRMVVPEFEVDEENAATIAEICHRLDGMPLALELAAARFALFTPEQVLERLTRRFRFLNSHLAGRERRHRSLMSLLEWSFALLSAEEQRLLKWCSVFSQGWATDAALSLSAELGHDAETGVQLLSGLVDRSLVNLVPGRAGPRYRLLETVREYALSQILGTDEEDRARRAHLQVMVKVCRTAFADMRNGRVRERVEALTHEGGNIAAALETAAAMSGGQTAAAVPGGDAADLDILGYLVLYAKCRGEYMLYAQRCRSVLARAEPTETLERARAMLTCGVMLVFANVPFEDVHAFLPEAGRIAALHGDWWTEGYAHGYYAMTLANWGRTDEAEAHAAITERYFQAHGDEHLGGLAGLARGWIHLKRGEAIAALTELTKVREMGSDLHQQHFIEIYLGLITKSLGQISDAARHWLEAMSLSGAVANVRGIAGSIEGCAYLACMTERWIPAARLLAAAALIRERTGVPMSNLWQPHHDEAVEILRRNLAEEEFTVAWKAGAALRQEDSAEEAQVMLREIA